MRKREAISLGGWWGRDSVLQARGVGGPARPGSAVLPVHLVSPAFGLTTNSELTQQPLAKARRSELQGGGPW